MLDVKVGVGAFTLDLESGRRLARLMVAIANLRDRRATALLSDMNQPLGKAVGNALEVREAIDTLQGGGPADFREHTLTVASHMLLLGDDDVVNLADARAKATAALDDGSAWDRFRVLVQAQGGSLAAIDDPTLLPTAPHIESVSAPRSGHLAEIHARKVGEAVVRLGGGRERKGEQIDHAVGVEILRQVGDQVTEGDPLFVVHAATVGELEAAKADIADAHRLSDSPVAPLPLFYDTIEGS